MAAYFEDCSMLETMEISSHPIITEDTYTMGTRGCCQHCDEPLPHSRDSPNKEYDQSEDRKSSMTSNSGNWRPEFANVWSEVRSITAQYKGQLRLEMMQNIFLLRTNLWGSKVADPVISTYSWLDDELILRIENLVDKTVRKSVNFLSLVLKGYNKNFNSARQPDNSHYYRTESLHRLKILQDEDPQTSDELYSHIFNDSTLPPVEGAIWINRVLQNALQALILQILLILKIALQCRHVVILMVILAQVDCKDVQVHINCTSAAVITSPNYPSTYPQYESIVWSVTAPEGRMILLTFNNFSLGPLGEFTVIDTVDGGERQRYNGEENTIPPFLSRRNSLRLRFTSDGTPTGNGFNISASCYDLSETRVGRLMGGHTPAEGFLELQAESGGEWMRVCEVHSADRVAEVVCGELGFAGAKEVSNEQGGCSSEGADPGCIRAPRCENYAYRSQDCSDSSEKCTSSLAVKVKCFEPGFKGCYDLRNTRLQDGFSYNSTSQCITSCRANTSQAIAIINGSECFCSTTIDVEQMEVRSCALHQLVYNATVGFCNQTDDIMNGSWDSDVTWFGSIVHLTCDDGYRINGSGTLQCVTEVSSYLHVWKGSIPTCEIIINTTNSRWKNAAIAISTSIIVTVLLICIVCFVVRRGKIQKKCASPLTTATGEFDRNNLTRALPQPPVDGSLPTMLPNRFQQVTRTPQNPNNSSTLHPSLELTALQHGNNIYASGNPYHYAISMTHLPQITPNMGNPVNAYELGDSIDRNANDADHRTEMMPMFNRPLPHRPISVGVHEDPSLPPRERHVIHSSSRSPNLKQNARSVNSHLGACSLSYNPLTNGEQGEAVDRMPRNCAITKEVVAMYPFKGATSNENAHHAYYFADNFEHNKVHKGGDFPLLSSKLNPFYHRLEDDDQQMCNNDCDTDVLINNESNAHDDNLAEVMVDNVLYNPMDF